MFTKDDLAKYRAFKLLVSKSKIELQGEAVMMAASLFNWFNEVEGKINASIAQKEMMTVKEKEEPIKSEPEEKKGKK